MATDVNLMRRLQDDLRDAMRAGDQVARDAIRFTMAAVKNAEIDKGGGLDPAEEVALLQRQAKRQRDSIDQFRAAGRLDLVGREEAQLAVVERYLPAALSDEELGALVSEVVTELGASSPKEMGKVMPVVIERAAGRADGKRLSSAVREALARAGG